MLTRWNVNLLTALMQRNDSAAGVIGMASRREQASTQKAGCAPVSSPKTVCYPWIRVLAKGNIGLKGNY